MGSSLCDYPLKFMPLTSGIGPRILTTAARPWLLAPASVAAGHLPCALYSSGPRVLRWLPTARRKECRGREMMVALQQLDSYDRHRSQDG